MPVREVDLPDLPTLDVDLQDEPSLSRTATVTRVRVTEFEWNGNANCVPPWVIQPVVR